MPTLWMGVRPGPDVTRLLVQDGPIPILKARLPDAPHHPRVPGDARRGRGALVRPAAVRCARCGRPGPFVRRTTLARDRGQPHPHPARHDRPRQGRPRPPRAPGLGGLGDFADVRQLGFWAPRA